MTRTTTSSPETTCCSGSCTGSLGTTSCAHGRKGTGSPSTTVHKSGNRSERLPNREGRASAGPNGSRGATQDGYPTATGGTALAVATRWRFHAKTVRLGSSYYGGRSSRRSSGNPNDSVLKRGSSYVAGGSGRGNHHRSANHTNTRSSTSTKSPGTRRSPSLGATRCTANSRNGATNS